ncbi:TraR/DksA family transcriptional regulator [Streptomyces sp. DSM 118878]
MVNHQTIGDRAEHLPPEHLPPEDLAALRENLHEQRLFRREQLRKIDAGPRADDHRCSVARAEVQDKLAASARMVLADVEAALRRIDEGGYGICHLCRRPVERERLMIVPQARYCGRCQHVREARR